MLGVGDIEAVRGTCALSRSVPDRTVVAALCLTDLCRRAVIGAVVGQKHRGEQKVCYGHAYDRLAYAESQATIPECRPRHRRAGLLRATGKGAKQYLISQVGRRTTRDLLLFGELRSAG